MKIILSGEDAKEGDKEADEAAAAIASISVSGESTAAPAEPEKDAEKSSDSTA